MIDPVKKIRQVLFSVHPVSYRIIKRTPDSNIVNRKLFVEAIEQLKKIEERRDFMQDEIGMDMTAYEDSFFSVIENLMKIAFSKEQLNLIKMYLYDLLPDKSWDGTITIEETSTNGKLIAKTVNFKSASDVWNVVQKYEKKLASPNK
jgi:hypothetical protein